jgi:hypothetical protein
MKHPKFTGRISEESREMLEKERCYVTHTAWRAPVYERPVLGFNWRERPIRSRSRQKGACLPFLERIVGYSEIRFVLGLLYAQLVNRKALTHARGDVFTRCCILFPWNTHSAALIVVKKFRWFSTCPFGGKPTSKTAKFAANQSRSPTASKTTSLLVSMPGRSSSFVPK